MKNYTRINIDDIKNFNFIETQLRAGHIIIQILISKEEQEIAEITSYANDRHAKTYYKALTTSDAQLKANVITEQLEPFYAFKSDDEDDRMCADIDINYDFQNIISFNTLREDFKNAKDILNENLYYEYYMSVDVGDIANFGGPLELDFIADWMAENGFYTM